MIKDLKEKLKKAQNVNSLEIEHVKCKLIMERHDREKEQADHAKMIKYVVKCKIYITCIFKTFYSKKIDFPSIFLFLENFKNYYTMNDEIKNNLKYK